VPVILPLLERLDTLDMADQGQKFGAGLQTGLRAVVGLFEQDKLGAVASKSMIIAANDFINTVVRGWQGIIVSISFGLIEAAKSFGDEIKSQITGNTESRVNFLQRQGANALSATTPGILLNKMGIGPKQFAERFDSQRGAATNRAVVSFFDTMEETMAESADFEDMIDTTAMRQELSGLIEKARAGVEVPGPMQGPATGPGSVGVGQFEQPSPLDTGTGMAAAAREILSGGVSSLAAIGGGGGVGALSGTEALVDQSREQTGLLKNIWKSQERLGESIRQGLYGTPQPAFLQ